MSKTKTKPVKRVPVDEDEDEPLLPPEPQPEPTLVRRDTGMVLDMEGHGGEVASALVVNGLRAYLSVVNKGVNLVAANRSHTLFIPVKISACVAGLDVRRDDAEPLAAAGGVLAFLRSDGDERTSYYLPVAEYLGLAVDRGESGLRLEIESHAGWLTKCEGHAGIRRAFAKLIA